MLVAISGHFDTAVLSHGDTLQSKIPQLDLTVSATSSPHYSKQDLPLFDASLKRSSQKQNQNKYRKKYEKKIQKWSFFTLYFSKYESNLLFFWTFLSSLSEIMPFLDLWASEKTIRKFHQQSVTSLLWTLTNWYFNSLLYPL